MRRSTSLLTALAAGLGAPPALAGQADDAVHIRLVQQLDRPHGCLDVPGSADTAMGWGR